MGSGMNKLPYFFCGARGPRLIGRRSYGGASANFVACHVPAWVFAAQCQVQSFNLEPSLPNSLHKLFVYHLSVHRNLEIT
jgi:hypothetical protein